MRDPNRLYNFYDELRRIHMEYVPDWRFGQMMFNIFGNEDIFYLEETTALKRIKAYFGEITMTREQVKILKDAYESNREVLDNLSAEGSDKESFEQGFNNAMEFVFSTLGIGY